VGEIEGQWLTEEQKEEILVTIGEGKEKGFSIGRLCAMWRINRRRVVRWRGRRKNDGRRLCNLKPGPRHPVHTLLPEEKASVLRMAGREEYADLAHRILAVKAWEKGIFFVSFSSVYRILRSAGLMSMRGTHCHHNGSSMPPVRKELTGPNQRWCWDISYLLTFEKGVFLYLYLLLDEYSRKVIHWLVSWHQDAEQARRLLEGGLIEENILDLPDERRPEVINDRGRQMKAKSIKRMFEDLHMPQLFARPRTPNDNPFAESMFGTVKRAPEYPGRFLDREAAGEYCSRYFPWYNTEHYHSGIDYVTPDQCHRGLREKIVAQRRDDLGRQRQLRKEVNHTRLNALTDDGNGLIISPDQMMACSVINS
jgi:putative transposase